MLSSVLHAKLFQNPMKHFRLPKGFPYEGLKRKTNERRSVLDQRDFKAAVERYRDLVYRVAYSYLRSQADADDVTQNVFVKLYRTKTEFNDDGHLRNWLVRVAINECKTLFKLPWRKDEDIEEYESQLPMEDTDREVFRAVMGLQTKYRIPVILYYYLGYSTAEVAQLMGIPAATARTRLVRARTQLKDTLGGDGL